MLDADSGVALPEVAVGGEGRLALTGSTSESRPDPRSAAFLGLLAEEDATTPLRTFADNVDPVAVGGSDSLWILTFLVVVPGICAVGFFTIPDPDADPASPFANRRFLFHADSSCRSLVRSGAVSGNPSSAKALSTSSAIRRRSESS